MNKRRGRRGLGRGRRGLGCRLLPSGDHGLRCLVQVEFAQLLKWTWHAWQAYDGFALGLEKQEGGWG